MLSNSLPVEKIRLYLGYAPGKTTALNGIIIRMLGAEKKVKIILFSKCAENTSESKIYKILKEKFEENFDYFFAGESRIREDGTFRYFGDKDGWTKKDEIKLEEGLVYLEKAIKNSIYDFICVDEFTDLIYHKKIDENRIKKIFKDLKNTLIITGHLCPEWLKDLATTVIEGKVYKHYQGNTMGIEY